MRAAKAIPQEDRSITLGGKVTGAWLDRHPVLVAFAAIGIVYATTFGWNHPVVFVGTIAAMAFIEMAILSSEVSRLREKIDDLESDIRAATREPNSEEY